MFRDGQDFKIEFKRFYRGWYSYYMIGLMDSKKSFDFEKILILTRSLILDRCLHGIERSSVGTGLNFL